jgi:hypothetical protein
MYHTPLSLGPGTVGPLVARIPSRLDFTCMNLKIFKENILWIKYLMIYVLPDT